jgi:hypothetical protein
MPTLRPEGEESMAFSSESAESGVAAKPAARRDDGEKAMFSFLLALPLFLYRLFLLLHPLPRQDFISYWSAGRLFLLGGDPYSPSACWRWNKRWDGRIRHPW